MPEAPRTTPRRFQSYSSNIVPPTIEPIMAPRLMATVFNAIIVPRNRGICSNAKLVDAAYRMPVSTQPSMTMDSVIQNVGTLRYPIANIPTTRVTPLITTLRPYLFTNRPLTKLPQVKLNADNETKIAAMFWGITNCSRMNDA